MQNSYILFSHAANHRLVQQLLLTTLDGPFVDLIEVFLERHFSLQAVLGLFVVAENYPNLFFESVAFIHLLGDHLGFFFDAYEQQFEGVLNSDGVLARPAVHQELREVKDLLGLDA